MLAIESQPTTDPGGVDILEVLCNRYGNGLVYIRQGQRPAYYNAIKRGFINYEGFLTVLGRNFLAEHDSL